MDSSTYLPAFYLLALSAVLGVVGFLVVREVQRNRRQEGVITRLQTRLRKGEGTAEEHYELGSVYLEKKLYDSALAQFRKSLKVAGENIPLVCNAMGYTYFSQEQYDRAIRSYKDTVAVEPTYATAWNNLGHAYEKKNLIPQAVEAYENALENEPENDTARLRATALRKRLSPLDTANAE